MAINKISGKMLQENLLRDGVDIAIDTSLLYVDVTNGRIGINTSTPAAKFQVVGTAYIDSVAIENTTVGTAAGNLVLKSISNHIVLDAGSGIVSVSDARIVVCADPVADQDVVNKRYLETVTSGLSYSSIYAGDSSITVTDPLIGSFDFVLDGVQIAQLNTTTLDVDADGIFTGNITAAGATLANLSIAGNAISSTTSALSLNAAVSFGGIGINRMLYTDGAGVVSSTADFTFNSATSVFSLTGSAAVDDITIDSNSITSANSLLLSTTSNGALTVNTGAGEVNINSTSALGIPVGSTIDRPGAPATGHIRWNTTTGESEIYDGTTWNGVQKQFNVTSQQIVPNGVSVAYPLDKIATTDGILVSINGIIMDPHNGLVYFVAGNTITFSSILTPSDIVSIRFLEF